MTRYALLLLLLGCKTVEVDPRFAPVTTRGDIIARDIAFRDSLPLLRFNPLFAYGAIRLAVEQCVGRTRAGWPRFYVAPINPLPGLTLAFYDERTQSIVFALGNEVRESTAAHELMHWILAPVIWPYRYRDESPDEWTARVHPDSLFGNDGKCSHLLNPGR